MTAHEIFSTHVRTLLVVDRLQLVRLIMDDLAESASQWVVDVKDAWSDEDLSDVRQASLMYATQTLTEDANAY